MARPWISINLAVSADGKISSRARVPSGWTSRQDHTRLLELRRGADALLVGRGTLEADRMTLCVDGADTGARTQPLRCVVSRAGVFDVTQPLFQRPGGPIHLLATGGGCGLLPKELLGRVTTHCLSLAEFLDHLGSACGVGRLHCEGGGELIRSLAELDVIDEFHLTLAGHTLFGGQMAPTATGVADAYLPPGGVYSLTEFMPQPEAGECFLSYIRRR